MYVEVGGRQTGKTTRLVDNMISFLKDNPNKTALIVTKNAENRKRIQREVTNKCGRPCEFRTITSHKMLPPVGGSSIKQYVDEFFSIDSDKLVIDRNAYYVGTPGNNNYITKEIVDVFNGINQLKPHKKIKKIYF